ncbi:MAG: hypothetical protein FJ100_10505 [Deltaproteobacteria bacterium]|nr:hypothetical protein [Deltaproteobacteria bacterium]
MSLLLAALRARPLTEIEGLWPLPALTPRAGAQTLALALAAGDDTAVVQVPWAACDPARWPASAARRWMWWVPDAPQRALGTAVRRRLGRLPAKAIVLQGALVESTDCGAHRALVTQAEQALAEWFADAAHPLRHLGLAAVDAQRLGRFADNLCDLDDLVARAVVAALQSWQPGQTPDGAVWRTLVDRAVAAATVARFEALGSRASGLAIGLWMGSVRRLVDADDRTVRGLRRVGLLRADGHGLGWSAIARGLGEPTIGRALRAARPDWPWHLAGLDDGVDRAQAREVVAILAGCALLGGLQPRSDGALERLGVTALRQAIDQSFDRGDPIRRVLGPWIDLTARVTTTAAARWRTDDVHHLRAADATRQRLAQAATTANARFAVAALFDALHLFEACARPDAGEVMRTWTSLQWTLDRMGPTARPALAWLRLVVARSCVGQSSPAQYPYWAAELGAAEAELGAMQTFAPALLRTRTWLAWSQGDSRRAQELWTASGHQAGENADASAAVDSALDLSMSLVVTGDAAAALRIARPLAQRLTADRDPDRTPWAAATWILAGLCIDPANGTSADADLDPASAHAQWDRAAHDLGDVAPGDAVVLGGLVRCAALLAEGRASEAQPLLAWASKQARKAGQPAFATAARFGLGFCYLWACDRAAGRRMIVEALAHLPLPAAADLVRRGQALLADATGTDQPCREAVIHDC